MLLTRLALSFSPAAAGAGVATSSHGGAPHLVNEGGAEGAPSALAAAANLKPAAAAAKKLFTAAHNLYARYPYIQVYLAVDLPGSEIMADGL